ncbi:hypothetical protein HYW43_00705 [Candidatus Daviesbacteria bacterium]|nr:hypothetical protein [Candidatus Daviesbacteria bacterium]
MTEKNSRGNWRAKSQVLWEILATKRSWENKLIPKLKSHPNSGLNKTSQVELISNVNQDPQVKATLEEAEEVLHDRNRTY